MDPFTLGMMGLGLGMQGAGMFMGGGGQGGMMPPRPNIPQPPQAGGQYKQPFQMPQTASMMSPPRQRDASALMQYMTPPMMNYYAGGIR